VRTHLSQTAVAGLLLALSIGVTTRADARSIAKTSPALFPAKLSPRLLRELVDAGRVSRRYDPREPNAWKRWGNAAPEEQERALRAVVAALTVTRPALDVSAAILAIARVESGFNPASRNPNSTACGIFQFIEATWASYGAPRELCTDPELNASAGVKHITMLHDSHVRAAMPPLRELPNEGQRAEHAYRLLYAYHYHGESSPYAEAGGSIDSQLAAEGGVPFLHRFYSILKRATVASRPAAARRTGTPKRAARRPPARGRKVLQPS